MFDNNSYLSTPVNLAHHVITDQDMLFLLFCETH